MNFFKIKNRRIVITLIVVFFTSASLLAFGQSDSTSQVKLTREMIVSKALEKSFGIKNQYLEVKKDQFDKKKVLQTYLPNVSFNSTYTRLNSDIQFQIPSMSIPTPLGAIPLNLPVLTLQERNIWKADVTATMVLFTGLKAPLLYKVFLHKENADEELIEREKANVIKETVDFYNRLALVEQSLIVLEKSRKRLDEETTFAKKAYQQGLINAYDLSKIDIAQQTIEAKTIELNSDQSLVISKIKDLTSLDRSVLEVLHPELTPFIYTQPDSGVEGRPEMKALAEAIKANGYKNKVALSGYLPNIYAFSKKELRTNDLSVFDPQWYIGVGLRWNIFDGLQNMRDAQKAKIDQNIAQNSYDNASQLFNLNLEKAKSDVEVSRQLIKVASKKKITAGKGLEVAIKQYQVGLGSITERLAAEADMQSAEMEYIQAIYNQNMAMLNLMEATGQLTEENINR